MKTKFQSIAYAMMFLLVGCATAWSQGSTSSRINGSVVSNNEALIGATVLAIHEPTGFEYGTTTNVEGYFTLNNVNVGGPYRITVTYIGFEERVIENVFLSLGQTESFNVELSESSVTLDEIVVTAGGLFDGNRTGSETKVSKEQIASLPTADRGLNDYLRVTPQADIANGGGGISFAGINNRFNSIFIDGAVNNDVFGLANSGTNGGQAGISPISPDAIEQIQVVLAPYDVTLGGFAGGGINAVTRSGTNCFEGSVYGFYRDQNLSGKTPTLNDSLERTRLAPFSAKTYGARFGGPIIKNKLFFFANVEIQRDETPRPFVIGDYQGDSDLATFNSIRQTLNDVYGYEPGEFLNNTQTLNGEKFLLKLDYNISDKHKLTARHSYVKGVAQLHGQPNANFVVFGNRGTLQPSVTNSTAVELKSILGPNTSNNLIIGLTTVRDDRDILGDPFPQVNLRDGNGTISFGTDNFSLSNIVNQDVLTITNNFNLFKGKHNFTFGTHNEFFKIENLFTIFSTPRLSYFFDDVNRFLAGEQADLSLFGHEQAFGNDQIRIGDEAENLGPAFNAMQLALYGQDEIQVNKDFKLTLGLRVDVPIFTDEPPLDNTAFNTTTIPILESAGWDLEGARASKVPGTQLLLSPRVGFNYDVNGDNKTQLRGGIGVFTSRVPWVWPGGMFIRNGLNSAFNVGVGVGEQTISGDPQQWLSDFTTDQSPAGDVDLFSENFKYPQIFRSSLALDKKLPGGWNGTVELTYTKTLNNMNVKQINISPNSVGNLAGADNRRLIDFDTKLDPTYENITLVTNTNKGYTINATVQASKQFSSNTFFNIAYSYTDAKSLFDGRGFINNTNWLNVLSVEGNNNPSVATSTFATGSRITSFVNHKINYGGFGATTISIFYTGQSGSPFSYTYNGSGGNAAVSDISNSGGYEDLLYVPANQGEIDLVDIEGGKSADQQWAALDQFIEGDAYLSSRRGEYTEPNKSRTPFQNIIDLKIAQDIIIGGNKIQLTLDVFNFTNMINKNWGRRYFVGGNTFPLVQANRILPSDTEPVTRLEYNFRDQGEPGDLIQAGTYSARWNAQIGVRYSFDQCSNTGGQNKSVKNNNKLDTDGDGIRDSKDMCPNIPGIKKFKGCPMSEADMAAQAAAEAKMKAEEEVRMKAEAEAKRLADAEAARKAEAARQAKAKADAEAKLKAEENARLKAEEDAKMKAAAEAEARAKAAAALKARNDEVSRRFSASLQGLQFNSSRSTFKQASYDKMDEAVAVLNQYPDINVLIQGHTDAQGQAEKNQLLSQKRADAVKEYLVSKGIDSTRLSTNGLGEEYPVADNNTAAGRAQNRRVEFIIRNN